ncbi:MAG: hypothetical protein RQ936_04650 [Gammaproteobacteria bacterium]|nr:hypothetical protein [Gammaproteobacteria bacterium]
MALGKAQELIAMHVSFGSGYNRNATRMISGKPESAVKPRIQGKVMRDFGQTTVDQLVRDYDLEERWDIKTGAYYDTPL